MHASSRLNAEGYIVYDDHRGHGRTGMRQYGGDASKLGRLGKGGMKAAEAACWQLTELIRSETPTCRSSSSGTPGIVPRADAAR
jgi:hypothetical protein